MFLLSWIVFVGVRSYFPESIMNTVLYHNILSVMIQGVEVHQKGCIKKHNSLILIWLGAKSVPIYVKTTHAKICVQYLTLGQFPVARWNTKYSCEQLIDIKDCWFGMHQLHIDKERMSRGAHGGRVVRERISQTTARAVLAVQIPPPAFLQCLPWLFIPVSHLILSLSLSIKNEKQWLRPKKRL